MDLAESEKPLVLVVDDLSENTRILRDFLSPQGYRVIEAGNGKDALATIAEMPPDVILLDLVMPGMDGFEVCQTVKSSPATRHIPVIVITGLAERRANIRAVEAGADDFITKPFDIVLLRARIRNSLRTKRLHDQIMSYQHQLEDYNVTLEERIAERTAEVARIQQAAVFSLAKLAESRDPETGEHLDRIRMYARIIATELAFSPKYREMADNGLVEGIYQSSPLHDIGKVGIPDRILLKTGKLSPAEFDIMKTHTIIGGETLDVAIKEAGTGAFLQMGRDIAYSHHERWDGRGYPCGLAGENIPPSARIVAVSDVYDALTSKRPYKEPLSHEESCMIIMQGRGSQFDPEVVDAFFAREKDIYDTRTNFRDTQLFSRLQQLEAKLDQLVAEEEARNQAENK